MLFVNKDNFLKLATNHLAVIQVFTVGFAFLTNNRASFGNSISFVQVQLQRWGHLVNRILCILIDHAA